MTYNSNLDKLSKDSLLYDKADKWLFIHTCFSYGISFPLFFWRYPPKYLIIILMVLPPLLLGMSFYFGGAFKFHKSLKSRLEENLKAFAFPCLVLALRANLDFDILSWNKFWFPFILFLIVFSIITLSCLGNKKESIIVAIVLLAFSAAYSYSTIIYINDFLDSSEPSIYNATIIKKRLSKGSKQNYYYFKLSPWGSVQTKKELKVRKTAYQKYHKGDSIKIIVRKGNLLIPFYYVY